MNMEKETLHNLTMDLLAVETNLEFDGGSKENRLFDDMINTRSSHMTEIEYKKMQKDLDTFEIKGNGFTVAAWNDSSGFHYWNVIMKEDNYIQITVYVENLDCDAEKIKNAVQKARNHFTKYERHF